MPSADGPAVLGAGQTDAGRRQGPAVDRVRLAGVAADQAGEAGRERAEALGRERLEVEAAGEGFCRAPRQLESQAGEVDAAAGRVDLATPAAHHPEEVDLLAAELRLDQVSRAEQEAQRGQPSGAVAGGGEGQSAALAQQGRLGAGEAGGDRQRDRAVAALGGFDGGEANALLAQGVRRRPVQLQLRLAAGGEGLRRQGGCGEGQSRRREAAEPGAGDSDQPSPTVIVAGSRAWPAL